MNKENDIAEKYYDIDWLGKKFLTNEEGKKNRYETENVKRQSKLDAWNKNSNIFTIVFTVYCVFLWKMNFIRNLNNL